MKMILSHDQSKTSQLQGKLVETTVKERFALARKRFFIFFGLAIVSVFIPVAHFVLVPAFLIISIVVAVKSYGIRYRLELAVPPLCLQCKEPLKATYFLGEELRIKCEKCFAQYSIEN